MSLGFFQQLAKVNISKVLALTTNDFNGLLTIFLLESFISVILDGYGKVFVSVKWNNSFAAPRQLLAGVRQGGVLSPSLFNVYVNGILVNLQQIAFGFWQICWCSDVCR